MKHCGGCDSWKDESEFNWKNQLLKIRQSHCKVCQSEQTKRHYRNNPAPYRLRAKERNHRIESDLQEYVFEYLNSHPCIDCGEPDPIVPQFDHVEGEKDTEVTTLIKNAVSLYRLKTEIAKCEVRCANCHMRRHAQTRKIWKLKYK